MSFVLLTKILQDPARLSTVNVLLTHICENLEKVAFPPNAERRLLRNESARKEDTPRSPLDAVVDTFRDLITATVEASKPPSSSKDKSNRHFKSDPFWLFTTIFKQLILSPRPPKHELPPGAESTTQCIYRRLRWFRAGRISELYEESRKVKSKPPSSLRSSSNDSSYRERRMHS